MARTRFVATRTIYNPNGSVASTEVRHVEDTDERSCTESEVAFLDLSPAQKLIRASTMIPAAATSKHWELQDCTGGTSSLIYATVDRANFTPDSTSEPTTSQDYESEGDLGGIFTVTT